MTDNFDFDFDLGLDDVRPRTWGDAFPWLVGAAGAAGANWADLAIDETDSASRQSYLAQISELAMERLTQWTIGQIFPGLSPDLDLLAADLPARAVNALGRANCGRSGQLMAVELWDLLNWRHVGVGTVDAILQWLADASTSSPTPSVAIQSSTPSAEVPREHDSIRMPDWMSTLVEDLNTVAIWFGTIGLPDQPLVAQPLPQGTPPEVIKARERVDALCASNILTDAELELDVAGLFDDALGLLDSRARQVLGSRLFADDPMTLDQLGQLHDVTRERIRQIEGKARGALLTFIEEGVLAAVAESARDLIGTIRPLDELLELIPSLGVIVEGVGQPAWRVLDRLDDAYEIEDGWCVVPTMREAELITQKFLEERTNPYGVIRVDEVRLIETNHPERLPQLSAAWLSHCGYIVDGDFVLIRTSSVNDYAASVLYINGSPLSTQEIVDRFVFDRSPRSLGNALSGDDRFERVDRDRWALKEWGLDAYAGIRSVIREQVARAGGRAKLTDLVEHITSRYSVSGSSVVAYAAAAPFATKDGIVQLATEDQSARKAPERTRRLFRRPDAWAYRVRITSDHLRGSGSVAPNAVATILGLRAGETRQLDNPLGPQAVAWTGLQPQFGTIRRFLMAEDIAAGTEAFLVLNDDGTFAFELMRDLIDDPVADALSMVGAPPLVAAEQARIELARAIKLPDDSPVTSIVGGYRGRGDEDVADLLIMGRERLETGHTAPERKHSAQVNDILDLL